MSGNRLRVGLTGGIASGKSTAATRFGELGVAVIDADESARAVVAPGMPGLEAVLERFGRHLRNSQGELNRRALRDIIFANPEQRQDLEFLLHPLIRADMERRSERATGPYVVFEIPLLVENGRGDRVDRVLVIDVDEQRQIERLMARDQTPMQQAAAILAAQATRAARLSAADDVISNTGSVDELRHAIDQIHQRYLSLSETFAGRAAEIT